MKVFINPGHCKEIVNGYMVDSGAVNKIYDVTEAEIVYDIGELLKAKLEENDYEVKLEQSDNICGEEAQDWHESVCYHANDWMGKCGIVIALHCNACNSAAKGTEIFYGSAEGRELSGYIQEEIVKAIDTVDRPLLDGIQKGLWLVKYTDSICAYIEIAFIDNSEDCWKLINQKQEIADAIFEGIDRFVRGE